jgi:predicted permease
MPIKLTARLRGLFRRSQLERELDEEMRYHLEKLVEQHFAEGLSAAEARAAALKSFGGLDQTKEGCRDALGTRLLLDLARDIRYGVRLLRRSPAFAITAILSLGLGIGANAAIFSLVDALLLRPLPVRDPERLVLFFEGDRQGRWGGTPGPGPLTAYSYPLYQRLRADDPFFEGIAAEKNNDSNASVRRGGSPVSPAERAVAKIVTANYFDVLGVPAFRGRLFQPDDETAPGANPVLVLSHGGWQRLFGGDPAVLGTVVTVNGSGYRVVGVTPPGFTGSKIGSAVDIWVPMTMQAQLTRGASWLGERNSWWLKVFGRLRPGVSLAAAEARANVVLQQFLAEAPESPEDVARGQQARIALASGARGVYGLQRSFREPLLVLMTGVALLLLIAGLNVSHLLLARATRRQHELSVRRAMGASRGRLVRQLLAEGLLLSLLGSAAGLALMSWLTRGLLSLTASGGRPLAIHVSPEPRLLAFVAVLALGTTALLSLAPIWLAGRTDLQPALRITSRTVVGRGGHRLAGRLPLVSQVAFSLVLLVGAGLLGRSLGKLRDLNKGFDAEQVLLTTVMNPRMSGLDLQQAMLLYRDLLDRVTALPGVRAASLSEFGLLSGNGSTADIKVPGRTPERTEDHARIEVVTSDYFRATGMVVARGRGFSSNDRRGGPEVAVVNQAFARRFFGDPARIGGRFLLGPPDRGIQVVGIVADARVDSVRGMAIPRVYLPLAQAPSFMQGLEVLTSGDPGLLASRVRQVIHEANPDLLVTRMTPIRAQIDSDLWRERLVAALSTAFALVALFLVCVGLYGVMAQAVGQRTAEISVRMALGATQGRVRWNILREALTMVALGLVIGLPVAMAATRLLTNLLFGLSPADPVTLSAAPLALLAVAAVAAYLPARRASRIEPMVALRQD